MRVVWTEEALERLAEIEDFVSSDDPNAAVALVTRLIERGDSLSRFWQRGRIVRELPGASLRELVDGNYRIVYRTRKSAIEILTVFEGHRRFPLEDVER